jgi:hypothetical protein
LLERGRLADLYLATQRELSSLLFQAGDADGAVEAAHHAVAADPLSEEARFDLVPLYACTDRPAEALCQYRELEKMLRDELGAEPSVAIRQFALRLAAAAPAPPRTDAVPRHPRTPSRVAPRPAGPAASELLPPARPSLPLTLTRFFGREAELARLCGMLALPPAALETPGPQNGDGELGRPEDGEDRSDPSPSPSHSPPLRDLCVPIAAGGEFPRLITLTGPGGSGKTRLAIEAARRLSHALGVAVWFVPLADRTDPAQIPEALAETLRLPRSPDVDLIEQVAGVLAQQPSLLILDNMEHLLNGGGEIVGRLLEGAPALTCLVTSRQRLDLDGERELPVLPLPVPGAVDSGQWLVGRFGPADAAPLTTNHYPLITIPSVALFVDRAQAVRPDF